jgi:hypothetical protein
MRGRACIASFVAILGLSLLLTGIFAVPAFCDPPEEMGGWIQIHIMDVPDIEMYEPFFDLFGQRELGRPVDYTYEEALKLVGHSCGATAGGFLVTKRALDMLYPGEEIPVRGNIRVTAPGAEDEWNVGVIGEVITYITGAAPKTGFSGAEFGNGFPLPPMTPVFPGNPVYKRRNKMIYPEDPTGKTPPNQPFVDWIFERIDTEEEVCVRFWVGKIQPAPFPPGYWQLLGAKVASGLADPVTEVPVYIDWWNNRIEYLFQNEETLVMGFPDECPTWPPVP